MASNTVYFCVGIDLGDEYSQVSYYNYNDREPVSVKFEGSETEFLVPTVVGKALGADKWYVGDEALESTKLGESEMVSGLLQKAMDKNPIKVDDCTVMPLELMEKYLDYLMMSARMDGRADEIDMVCVTVENFHISLLNVIARAMENLGIDRSRFIVSSRNESYIYYALSQKPELWKNDVFLFDYSKKGLITRRIYMTVERGTRIVMVHEDDLSKEVPYVKADSRETCMHLDDKLTALSQQLFDKTVISSVYITGEGLIGALSELTGFVNYICNRRKVFAGQNLYCKGACYQAFEAVCGTAFKDFLLACPERITTGIEMKISDRGRDKILRMVRPGINWFEADCSFDFIVDDMDELEIFLSPLGTREKQLVRVPLGDFPKRPGKATRITVSFSFTSDSRCHMMVKDKGFGEFFLSSGIVMNEELLL